MLLRCHSIVLLFSVLLLLMVGCQGSGDPTVPGPEQNSDLTGSSDQPRDMRITMNQGHQLMALMECEVDWENETVSYRILRTAEQHLNLLAIIPIYCNPVSSCLDFQNIEVDMDNVIIELDVVVNHPIPDSYTDVFDMRGIGIFKSNEDPGFSDGPIATQIINNDGYTTAYDSDDDFYDAFLNPYIAFNKGEENRIFENDTTSVEHVITQFPSLEPDDSKFLYALDATWSDPLFYDPDDLETDPNMADPYEVRILHADPISDEYLSTGTVIVQVFDWQANAESCELEAPDFLGGSYEMEEVVVSEDGVYMYYYSLVNDLEAAEGWYKFLVKANDEFGVQEDLVDPSIEIELSNYQLGNVMVYDSTGNTPPVMSVVTGETIIQPFTGVTFDASSSTDTEDGEVNILAWDLDGDGIFDNAGSSVVQWVYNEIGTYAVNVIGTDSQGLSDVLDEPIIIHVTPITNTAPTAAAEVSANDILVDEEITLDASASTDLEDGKPVSWEWDLDNDDVYDDAVGEVVPFSWDTAGVYFVDVLVKDSGNLGDTLNTKILVEVSADTNQAPTASAFSSHISAVVGEEVTFDGSASTDPEDEKPVQWQWDIFGGGTYTDAYGETILQKFWSPGFYNIDLKVLDSKGLFDTLDETISIEITGEENILPVAVASADKLFVVQFEHVHFDATDSYDEEDGEIENFAWDLDGDGTYFDAFSAEVDHFYSDMGEYYVDVRVTDSKGATDILDEKIAIQVTLGVNMPPVAVAEADNYFIFEGGSVTFDGSNSTDLEDTIPISWEWDLDDDGEYDDSPFVIVVETFDTVGEYLIDLKVTDSGGLWDALDEEILITVLDAGANIPPNASAEVSCLYPTVGQKIHLTDFSSDLDGEIVQWEWDFGDGEGWQDFTETQGNTTFTSDTEDSYLLDLRVTDDEGMPDTLNSKINVLFVLPDFEIPGGTPDCGDAAVHLMNGSAPLDMLNTSTECRDLAFLNNGTFVMVISDALYNVFPPSFVVQPALMADVGWVKSIDSHSNGTLALSNLDDGIIKLYQVTGEMELELTPMLDIDVGAVIQAVCFDNSGNLWAYYGGILSKYSQPMFTTDSCDTYLLDEVEALGTVNDMDYNVWNHSIYIAVADGGNGTVARINHVGSFVGSASDILLGPSGHLDILCDKNLLHDDNAGCRIVVAGGSDTGYMTRIDTELTVLDQVAFGYWGLRSIALSMDMSNTILGLEDCCLGWIDLFTPSYNWSDWED